MSRNSGEVYWGDELVFKVNKLSNLTQSFRMFNNISDTGQYRVNFDMGMVTKMAKWFSWQIDRQRSLHHRTRRREARPTTCWYRQVSE